MYFDLVGKSTGVSTETQTSHGSVRGRTTRRS